MLKRVALLGILIGDPMNSFYFPFFLALDGELIKIYYENLINLLHLNININNLINIKVGKTPLSEN